MNIQSETVRKYILENLEEGVFKPGSRLPGSRKISETLDISRPVVQNVLDTLVNEGVLRSVARSGLYVDRDWVRRRIRNSLKIYTRDEYLPWMAMFRRYAQKELPELYITGRCEEGAFEIVTTALAQAHHREFADILPVLESCYPDLSAYHVQQLKPFMQQGRLTALPVLFSPRIIACNCRMLRDAGCEEPSPAWDCREFEKIVDRLRRYYPAEKIFPWNTNYYCWMNFLLSAGGKLFSLEKEDPVCFDAPEVIRALQLYRSLRGREIVNAAKSIHSCGDYVFSVIDRQLYGLNRELLDQDFIFLPIPGSGSAGSSIQATELFVMRRGCVENGLCARLIRFLWSEEFQSHLAELHYGIPVMKCPPGGKDACLSPADRMFEMVLDKVNSEYHLSSPDLFRLVSCGIASILAGEEDLESRVRELACTVRNYLKYTQTSI